MPRSAGGMRPDPTVYIPKKPVFHMNEIKSPRKSEMSFWYPHDDPKKNYKGNVDHWAKQRVEANIYAAKKKTCHTDAGVQVPPEASSNRKTMFVWAPDRQWRYSVKKFDEECMHFLGGQRPGELSKGKAKELQPEWMKGHAYEHARERYEYWPYDKHSPFQMPSKEFKLITSITSLPPHNLKRVKLMTPKAKKPARSNVPI